MTVISVLLLVLVMAGLAYLLLCLACVLSFFATRNEALSGPELPAVSVLKPLCGLDPALAGNVATFLAQDYPRFEVLFGFGDGSDPALPVIEEAVRGASCDARVIVNEGVGGANRKVTSLMALAEAARYPMLALSDSDMVVDGRYLRRIVGELPASKKRGIVTSLYKISRPESPGAALESLTIALDFIPSVLVARRMEGITFGLGASILVSKEAIADMGGFAAIADCLADDYQIGFRLHKKGYENVLSRHVIENRVGPMGIAEHLVHQVRWARTYRASRPKGFAGYGITHAFTFALLLLLVRPGYGPAALLCAVLALRYALALAVYRKAIGEAAWLKWLFLVPLKDVLGFLVWLWSFAGSKVRWRGACYKVAADGRIVKEDGG